MTTAAISQPRQTYSESWRALMVGTTWASPCKLTVVNALPVALWSAAGCNRCAPPSCTDFRWRTWCQLRPAAHRLHDAGPAGGEWPIAAYELALLQHTRGCHGEADALAKRLGFKTRLADDIFSPGPSPNVGAVPQPPPPGVRVLDQVLSVDLLRQVR